MNVLFVSVKASLRVTRRLQQVLVDAKYCSFLKIEGLFI